MNKIWMTAGMAALVVVAGMAQTAPPKPAAKPAGEEPYRIRTFTKLVQVPVIVTKGGRHVRGLKKEDFSIVEQGVPRAVATFEEVVPSTERFQPAAEQPGEYTNLPGGAPQAPRRIIIIAVDVANSPIMNQEQGRRQLIKYLEEKIEEGSLFSLVAFARGRLVTVHELTSDPKVLVEALKRMRSSTAAPASDAGEQASVALTSREALGRPDADSPGRALERMEFDRLEALAQNQDPYFSDLRQAIIADNVLSGLRSLAKSYAGIPGRKSLFWVSSWFPSWQDSRLAISSSDPNGTYLGAMEALNDANISVYPIDARGLVGFAPGWNSSITMAQVRNPFANTPGMIGARFQTRDSSIVSGGMSGLERALTAASANTPQESGRDVAERTGGLAFYGTNDLVGAFRKADADAEHYYMLGYYLPASEIVRVGSRKLEVRVSRPGVKVRGRNRVFIAPQGERMDDVQAAVLSPLEFTMLPLTVKLEPGATSGDKADFMLTVLGRDVEVEEASHRIALDFVIIARDSAGTTVDLVGKTVDGKIDSPDKFREFPINLIDKLKLPPNGGTARFIVRDQVSGRIGSVVVEIAARP